MKVALVHELLHKFGGAERVLKVFADMFPDAPIYTLVYDEKKLGKVFPKERVKTSGLQKYFKLFGKRPQPLLPWMPRAVEEWNFQGYDLVISSSSACAHGIIVPLDTTHICYCHSPMRYAWDYTHEYNEEKSKGSFLKSFLLSRMLNKVRQWDRIAADRPDLYIANSGAVQKRLKKYYQQDSKLLYPPVQTHRFNAQGEKEDYFLVVSALTSYKKIDLAIEACNKLNQKLYIIGSGNHEKYLKSIAGSTISFLGRLDDVETAKYMEKAKAFLFPGVDDFGITVVESMAAGTPVIAFKAGGVIETVIPGKTGEFFEEQTVDSLCEAMEKFLQKHVAYDRNKMREHAEKFSEKKFKEGMMGIISQSIS